MMHEATVASDRLDWLVEERIGELFSSLTTSWAAAASAGQVPDVDPRVLYHSLSGSATLLYANAPEADRLGVSINEELVAAHEDALVRLFLGDTT